MSDNPQIEQIEAALGDDTRPLMFVTVGSDHHRFDRLIGWVDRWLGDHPDAVTCVMQVGTADPPTNGVAVDFLPHDLLERVLAECSMAVVQGGPMSIVESRRAGRRPIVVPRIARLHEVVDDHQVTFCHKLAAQDAIDLATSEDELRLALDRGLAEPGRLDVVADAHAEQRVAEAVRRFGEVADAAAGALPGTRPRLLLLGGAGRSGSTLLERLLGGVSGVTALGEVIHLWERGLLENQLCGCSLPFSECPFWQQVGKQAFACWSTLDANEAVMLRKHVVRTRRTPGLLGVGLSTPWRLQRNRLQRRVDRLYRAAADVSHAELLVDSSKHPAYALLARRLHVDARCVLVVRDPRAVAAAWLKSVPRPEITDEERLMPRYGPVRSSLTWVLFNAMVEMLRMLRIPLLIVRYEDLATDPRATLRHVLEFAGLSAADDALTHVHEHSADLRPSHTVAGNPMRFAVGSVPVTLDEEWRRELPVGQQRIVSCLTGPLRRRYGYRSTGRSPRPT